MTRLVQNGELKRLSGTLWEATGNDPWFLVAGRFRRGTYGFQLEAFTDGEVPVTPMKLYYAVASDSFREDHCFVFAPLRREGRSSTQELSFALPVDAHSLRFDPMESPGRFHLVRFRLRRRSALMKYLRVGGFLLRSFWRSPRGVLRDVEHYVATRARRRMGPETGSPVPVLDDLPNIAPINFRIGREATREPRLNVLIPGMALRAMSGGPNTAINLTFRVARQGVPIRYISTSVPMEQDEGMLWEHCRKLTGIEERFPHVEMVSAHDRGVATLIGENDVFFGTAWWTVQMIKYALGQTRVKKFIYLIQEYEPGLYPWSTVCALAMETYGLEFRGIINESLVMEYLRRHRVGRFADPSFADQCSVFEPAVDRTRFYPDAAKMGRPRKRLLFYARPQAPRNLYELGIVALKKAVERGAFPAGEWDLCSIGGEAAPADLGTGVLVRPIGWLDYDAYAALLRESDVGLSLMLSPHTGYPALEMAACGLTVVTNSFSVKTAERLKAISGNILPVVPALEAVVDGLIEASVRTGDLKTRAAGSLVSLPSSWDDALNPQVPHVIQMMEDCLR